MNAAQRAVTVAASTVLFVGVVVGAASADSLSDILERARTSTYSADRLIVSVWGGETQVSKSFVEHANGSEMVRVDSTWTMIGNGRAVTMDESPTGVAFMSHAEPIETTRYVVETDGAAQHLQRDCHVVSVYEGDVRRAVMVVDDNTGAALITEIYASDGSLFRRSSLQNFRAYRTYAAPSDPGGAPYEVVLPTDAGDLPDTIAGYELVDAFPAPASAAQGFYGDGLFTFSLFVMPSDADVTGFDDPSAFITARGEYDSRATSHDVRIHWVGAEHQYVLVGDLPPDHLVSVLSELPEPDVRSLFARWWAKLFG